MTTTMARSRILTLRTTPAEASMLTMVAEATGQSLSETMRRLVLRAACEQIAPREERVEREPAA